MIRLAALLLALLLPALSWAGTPDTANTVPSAGASFLSDLQNFLKFEAADRYDELWAGTVSAGCVHSATAGLTGQPSTCVAYPNGRRISESSAITYPDDSTCWVAVDDATTGNPGTFTRVSGTHYATDCSSSSLPDESSLGVIAVMRVTTSGGSITSVADLRPLIPGVRELDAEWACSCDGVINTSVCIQNLLNGSALRDWPIRFPPDATCLVSNLVAPAGGRVRLYGSGRGARGANKGSVLKNLAGSSNPILTIDHSHLVSEWHSEIRDLEFDNNAGTGATLKVYDVSGFLMRDVYLYNTAGEAIEGRSWYDSEMDNVFVENASSATGPMVYFFGTSGSDTFNATQINHLHIETSGSDAILLSLGANTIENDFVGMKLHGDETTSQPDAPLLQMASSVEGNTFVGGTFSRGTSSLGQIYLNGAQRNVFVGAVAGVGSSVPSCFANMVGAGRNKFINIDFKNVTYSNAFFLADSGTNHSLVLDPIYGSVPTNGVLADSGRNCLVGQDDDGTDGWLVSCDDGIRIDSFVRDGTGIQHGRVSTGNVAGTTYVSKTLTWGAAFPTSSYTAVCSMEVSSGDQNALRVEHIESKTTTTITVGAYNSGGDIEAGTIHCIGFFGS